MEKLPRSSVFANILLALTLIAIWITFAPTRIGGSASYVMVNGISMEPGYHLGDLTVMRQADEYQVGDVVTYRDAEMQAYVIHRIIGVEGDRFILKGDNNSRIDAYRPTKEEIIGKLWFHVPKLGRLFQWMRAPLNLALTIGLLGGVLMVNMLRSNQEGKRISSITNFGGMLEGGIYLFGSLAVIFLALGIFAFIRPLTRPADKLQYLQESRFSYSATGTPVIYDTNVVRSGEPVFPRLTCYLNIGFTYNVLGDQLQGISGTHQLVARVADEQSGWQRTIPMNQPSSFVGNTFSTTSMLDLCQIVTLVNTLEQETGLRANNYTLEIIPQVTMTGIMAGTQVNDSFSPRLVFRFDKVHFSLSTPKGQDDPLNYSLQSSVPNPNLEANTFSLLGLKPTVLTVRMAALFGLAISLVGLLLIGLQFIGANGQNEEAMIRLKYGALLVNVYERDIEPVSRLIDVTTIDELAKLAERQSTVILHMMINFLHFYYVQSNDVTYRYMFSTGILNTPAIEPPRREMVAYTFDVDQPRIVEPQSLETDLFDYVVNKNHIPHTEVEKTVILRRIKI